MSQQFCPECGGEMIYEMPVRRYVCRSCGLYATREELSELRERAKASVDERTRKKRERGEYLEWWLSKK